MKVTMIWMTAMFLMLILLMCIQLVQKKMMMYKEKMNQFECGFNMMNPTHIPFSFQFFLVALLFLIFDIEIALIISYPMETSSTKNNMMIFLFLMVLTVGLLYEWQKSKINWNK